MEVTVLVAVVDGVDDGELPSVVVAVEPAVVVPVELAVLDPEFDTVLDTEAEAVEDIEFVWVLLAVAETVLVNVDVGVVGTASQLRRYEMP